MRASSFIRLAFFFAAAGLAIFPLPSNALAIFSNIVLKNGWTGAPGETRYPGVSIVDGIVHMKGAISGGASNAAFTVPAGFRPSTPVHIRVDLCNGAVGGIVISPNGDGVVDWGAAQAAAQCRVSLEGVSYTLNDAGFTPFAMQNGWISGAAGALPAGARSVGEVVQLQGAVAGGSAATITALPAAMQPVRNIYLPTTLCNGSPGRLEIAPRPSGAITVRSADGQLSKAQCLTSFEGLSFSLAVAAPGLSLVNGWTASPFGTGPPGIFDVSGVFHFRGAVNNGSLARIFTLEKRFRPTAEIYVPVDLCNAAPGALRIAPSGAAGVDANGPFSDAQCFTSLDGVSFIVTAFAPIALMNGWTGGPFSTSAPAVARNGNVVTFTGAVRFGSSAQITTLAAGYRPPTDVYLPVDLCSGARGVLRIQPTGAVSVQSAGAFSDAQCFTSLDGASFVAPNAQTNPLTPQNGWTGGPLGTNTLRAQYSQDIVRLSGAISGGVSNLIMTLPPSLRPAGEVHMPVALCNAQNADLVIATDGRMLILTDTAFTNAQCMTSLDGVEYRLAANPAEPLFLESSWHPTSTAYPARAVDTGGVVRFSGMVTEGTSDLITILTPRLRPLVNVYIPVTLCNATKGRLLIQPSGKVRVFASDLAVAQCMTSLEGVSYPL